MMGAGEWTVSLMWYCLVPAGRVLAACRDAHTVGEFGVVLMIGGNIPEDAGAVIALFDAVESTVCRSSPDCCGTDGVP